MKWSFCADTEMSICLTLNCHFLRYHVREKNPLANQIGLTARVVVDSRVVG